MHKDPFLSFLSDLSKKITLEKEHKQLMEKINNSEETKNTEASSLNDFLDSLKSKLITSIETPPVNETSEKKTIQDIIAKDLEDVRIEVNVDESADSFTSFVDKLKNIISDKPQQPANTNTNTPQLSSKPNFQPNINKTKSKKKEKNSQSYISELEKIKDSIAIEKQDDKVVEIKKLIEEYAEKYIKKAIGHVGESGGGTNAVQYANGGTMNGNLNVNGNYLSGGINLLDIFASQPDKDQQTLSFNEVNYNLSISNGNTVSLSALKDNLSEVSVASGSWNSTYTTVKANSGYWESAIQTINGTNNQIVATGTGTGNHDNGVTLAFAQSAVFPGDVLIPGTLTVTGTATYINTKNLIVDDPIIFLANNNSTNLVDTGFVSHFKLGPPLNNTHTGLIRKANQNVPGYWTLFSGLTTEPLTAVNIDWSDPNIRLDTLSANIATNNGTSDQWNSALTTIQNSSGGWESSYTSFNSNSGKYDSVYTTTNSNSGNWNEAYTNLVAYSALYLSGFNDNRYFYKDISFIASPNTKYSTGTIIDSITAKLPLNSVIGDSVEFFDADGMWDINPLIIDNNGYNIESVFDTLSCNVRYGIFKLINTTPNALGWRIVPLPRHSDPSQYYLLAGSNGMPFPSYFITSSCGSAVVSNKVYPKYYYGNSYVLPGFTSYMYYNYSLPAWAIYDGTTNSLVYSAAGSPNDFPSGPWVSINPLNNPPPTITIPGFSPSEFITSYPPLLSSDGYVNNALLYGYLSSSNIPQISDITSVISGLTSLDLTYFTSLSLLRTSDSSLKSINLLRNNKLNYIDCSYCSLSSIDLRSLSKLKYLEISGNPITDIIFPVNKQYFSNINIGFTSLAKLNLSNLSASYIYGSYNSALSSININSITSNDTLQFLNNNALLSATVIDCNLKSFFIGNNSNCNSITITGCNINSFSTNFSDSSQIRNINLSLNSITGINMTSYFSLTSLTLPSRLRDLQIINTGLSATDTYMDVLCTNNYRNGIFSYTNSVNKTISRTSLSNKSFETLVTRGYTITPFELDVAPFPSRPTGYVPSVDSDSITVMCPISTRNGQYADYPSQYDFYSTRFNVATGEYIKVSETYNNRDVWKNSNEYFILFNSSINAWTLVGPLSTSSNIWLSASESYNEWGTPPGVGWFGKAFQDGGFTGGNLYNPATYGSVWAQSTVVSSTKNLLFSSFAPISPNGNDYPGQGYLGQGQARVFGDPAKGYNSSFYWNDYDFSGILYNSSSTSFSTGRGTLISPIHFVCNDHYLPWGGSGTTGAGQTLRLYNKDGTITNVTVLSSVQYPAGFDSRVGILNAPVTNTFYPIGSGSNFCNNVLTDFTKLSCFLVGPFQSSRMGIMPIKGTENTASWFVSPPYTSTLNSDFYKNSYTIPRSLMFGESIIGGDSSSQTWFLSSSVKRPILISGTQSSNGSGPLFGADAVVGFLKQKMDALSNQFSLPIYSPILVDK